VADLQVKDTALVAKSDSHQFTGFVAYEVIQVSYERGGLLNQK